MITEEQIKRTLPEWLTFFSLPFIIQAAVDHFPSKKTAYIVVIPSMCIIYLLLKWEANRYETH